MYTRILVPLDGSEVAEKALAHAVVQMADIFDAELMLLRAVYLTDIPSLELGEARSVLVKESETYLRDVAGTLRTQGRRVRTSVHWSQAAEAIFDYAIAQEVSVVVMATRGHRAPESWPIGSIAGKVLRSMQVPVLLICPSAVSDKSGGTRQSVT